MTTVTVYSTGPQCIRCKMTMKVLDQQNVTYVEVDIREDAAARTYVTEELGYSEAPVVVVDDNDHWSGFRPDHIGRIAALNMAVPSPTTAPNEGETK